jgi:ferredoxin
MKSGRPVFDGKCHFCLKCLYGCPTKALEPGMAKFIMIKEGYDLNRLESLQSAKEAAGIEEMSKAQLGKGVRAYLLEEDNCKP